MRRRRIVGWMLVALGVVILAAVAGAYLFLKSGSFQKLAIRKIIEETNVATGGRADIGSFDFQLSTLTAHLYNITIHGNEPSSQPPLLTIEKLTIGLKIQSLLRRRVTLSQLLIERPLVNIRVDQGGESNIPKSSQKQTSGGNTSIFDLAAQHVLLANGEITYNDANLPLDADLYGLKAEIRFDALATRYRGSISYDSGHLRYANEPTVAHNLNLKFSATPSNLSVESATLRAGASTISLSAEIAGYSNPAIEGQYDILLHTQDFAAMVKRATTAGDVSLSGKIHFRNSAQRSLLQSISIEGQIAAKDLMAVTSQGRLNLRKLRGDYQLRDGTFQAHDIGFGVLGGGITADVNVQHLDTKALVRIQMRLKGISLQAAQQAVSRAEFKRVNISGKLDGTSDVSWTQAGSDIHARVDLNIKPGAPDSAQPSSKDLPVDGTLHASYDSARDAIVFTQTNLRIPSTTISLDGNLSSHSNLQVQVNANDLHRIAALASALRGDQSAAMEIAGSASLKATVQGPQRSPLISGQFSGQNFEVQGSQWSNAKFDFQAKSSEVALHNAILMNAHQGKASLDAKVALQNWSYLPSNSLDANLSVQHMSVADLQRLADSHYPVSGDLSAEVSFHGSQLSPVGSGSARIENARAYDEPIQHLAATFHADKGSISSTLDVSLPAGSAGGEFSYAPDAKKYTLKLNAPSVALQKLQIVQAKNLGLTGTLAISAHGSGTLDDPQLTVALGIPQLQLRNNSISQLKGDLHVTNHRAEFAFDSQVAQASVHSSGHVDLAGDYYAEALIDTTSVPLAPLLAMYLPSLPQGFQGETELHASLKGPLKDKSQIEAHLTIPSFKASYQALQIGSAAPIRADYLRSAVTLQPAEIRGTGTSLRVQGSYPFGGNASPNLSAKGTVDVRVLRMLEPDIQSTGIISLDVTASGSASDPTIRGQVHLQDVGLSSINAPIGVQKLNGTFEISNDTLQLSNVAGEVGGGEVSVGGSISYRPNLRFNLSLQGKSVRLRYPDGLRAVLDGNLAFSGTKDASTLSGRVLIDTLSFTPDFDLAKFSDQFGSSTAPSEPGLADNVRLAVGVQSRGDLNASSSQLSVEGQVNVQLTGSAANPVVIGRTDLTSGELFYRNVRYQLQRGIITFDNPNETEPVMNISATTTVEQYNLTLTMRGPLDKLNTSYTSDPPLATADVINLIARGKTTQEQNAASQSTDSMLASQVASQATGSIQQLAGISSLQIDPLLGGNNQNPSARVAIQQRVTKNFLFTFSTDLSQPGTEIVQGDYQLNKRWSVSLTRDEVGGVSVGGKYHTKF